jgi:hypothetical protein
MASCSSPSGRGTTPAHTLTLTEHHDCLDRLAPALVRNTDDGRIGDAGMLEENVLVLA